MGTDHGRGQFHRGLHAAAWVVSAVGMSSALVLWRLHLHEAERRAEEAERTRDEVVRRQAVEERLRIARELHDSLTHSISVIQIQSGVAAHLARKRGEEVPPALLAITEAAADASRELRATLGTLRGHSGGSGLDQLDGLVARTRSAGLPVTVTVTGARAPLPPAVDQAAYRIIQEALTNTSRHAGPACARIHLHYGPGTLTVQVNDDGQGDAGTQPGSGLGLTGMRERVSALGGRLDAGPRDGGGFQVTAELPAGR